jgi:hypothetical protein
VGKLGGVIELLQRVLKGGEGVLIAAVVQGVLELGISSLRDQQRLYRQSWVIYGKDRDCVEESNENWIRVV